MAYGRAPGRAALAKDGKRAAAFGRSSAGAFDAKGVTGEVLRRRRNPQQNGLAAREHAVTDIAARTAVRRDRSRWSRERRCGQEDGQKPHARDDTTATGSERDGFEEPRLAAPHEDADRRDVRAAARPKQRDRRVADHHEPDDLALA